MKRPLLVFLVVLSTFCGVVIGATRAADAAPPAKSGGAPAAAAMQQGVVKFSPKMSAGALAGRPDTDLLEFPDGRRVKLGDIRRLTAEGRRIRAAVPGSKRPKAFRTRPASTGTPVAKAADLSAALKRPDNDTVVLPSGRRVTVGMIRLFQPEVEKRLGRPLAAGATAAAPSGPAVKVNAKSDWKTILLSPDGTVLEAPNGKRITVGELKQALAASKQPRRLPPAKR